ncbi:MAG: S41 family peptidase [bacterium]
MSPTETIDKRAILLIAAIVLAITIIAGATGVYVLSDPAISSGQRLLVSASVIDRWYHQEVDWDSLAQAGRDGMLDRLDRFSGYVSDQEFQRIRSDQSGGYSGLGVTISAADSGLLILQVRPGGPADSAQLLPGDLILMADSVDLRQKTSREASQYLLGRSGSTVALTIYRPASQSSFSIDVVRGEIPFEHVPYAGYTEDNVLYLRLSAFDPGAADAVEAALDSLISDTRRPRGMILDLRGNPGGLLREALQTADFFLDEGVFIAGTDSRSRWDNVEFRAESPDLTEGLPLVVLVDDGSASSSEIVAGALQQAGRARLVGDTTYGKGLVQGYVHFPAGDGLRLTISRYFLDGPVYLNSFDSVLVDSGRGLIPDSVLVPAGDAWFINEIERSLLLYQYAFAFQDEILADVADDTLPDFHLIQFHEFARGRRFECTSPITDRMLAVMAMAELEHANPATRQQLERMNLLTQRYDRESYLTNGGYLKRRIYALALQRQSSLYQAYARVLVPQDPQITLARQILLSGQ